MSAFFFKYLLTSFLLASAINIVNCKDAEGKTWAILHAGFNMYKYSYAFEGAIYKMYKTLKDGGIPDENIIIISPDSAAYSMNNGNPGSVTFAYEEIELEKSKNYYEEVKVDYSDPRICPTLFKDIWSGNKSSPLLQQYGSGKVLQSGPKDNVFYYYVGIGFQGAMLLNNNYYTTAEDFIPFLEKLSENKHFDKLFISMESFYSGTLFDDYLDSDKRILVHTLNGRYEGLDMCHFNALVQAYTSTCSGSKLFSYMDKMMEKNGGKDNIFDLFINSAMLSCAESGVHNLYGDIEIAKEPLTAFMGEKRKSSNDNDEIDTEALKKSWSSAKRNNLIREVSIDPSVPRKERDNLEAAVRNIVDDVIEKNDISLDIFENTPEQLPNEKLPCLRKAFDVARSQCYNNRNKHMLLVQANKFAQLCNLGISDTEIISTISNHCKDGKPTGI